MRIQADVVGLDEAIQPLQEASERIGGGLGPDWAGPAVSAEIAAIERELFATEGRGQWPPLSPTTVRARARRWGYYRQAPAAGVGAAHPILVWTGRLRDSLGDPRGRGSSDAVIIMTQTELVQGTKVPYAVYHQSRGARSTLPRRPFFDFSREDEERLAAVFEEFVVGGRVGEA